MNVFIKSTGSGIPPASQETREDPVPVYQMGSKVRLSASFVDDAGAPADPTAATLRVRNAAGTVTTPALVHDSTGEYHYDLAVPSAAASAGVWLFRVEGTGTVTAAAEKRFAVPASVFYP